MLSKNELMPFLYNKDGSKKISGYWKDSLFDIYQMINLAQENIIGNLGEIGVYCGRSFAPLANLKREGEIVVGIDVFKNTFYRNINNSYKSITNLTKQIFGKDKSIKIISICSKTLIKENTLNQFKPFRLFSIDGDHSVLGTLRDLIIANDVISPEGIIFLDDYDNPRFSISVLDAINIFLESFPQWKVLFVSTEKMFLCQKEQEIKYSSMFSSLSPDWKKSYIQFNQYKYLNQCYQIENIKGKNSWL